MIRVLANSADSLGIANTGETGPANVGVMREEIDEIFCLGYLEDSR